MRDLFVAEASAFARQALLPLSAQLFGAGLDMHDDDVRPERAGHEIRAAPGGRSSDDRKAIFEMIDDACRVAERAITFLPGEHDVAGLVDRPEPAAAYERAAACRK